MEWDEIKIKYADNKFNVEISLIFQGIPNSIPREHGIS